MTTKMYAHRNIRTALQVAITVLTTASSTAIASADGIVVHDARGRDVAVSDASRIVSVGGAITEILYALGLEDRIVGLDTTSLYPANALKDKPNVGYMRQLAAEGVLGLNPKLILAIEGSGPKETLDVLDAAKIPFVSVPEKFSEDGIVEKILTVSHAMNVDERGACLASAVKSDLAALKIFRANIKQPVRVMFVMSFVNGRAMVAGQKTAANEIIKLAGGINAVDGFEGYKPMNDEAVVAAKPEVVLSMQRGKDSLDAQTVFANPTFALTPAAASKSFVSMDGLYLLGFGPRTAAAAHDLAVTLYPRLLEVSTWKPSTLSADCRR